jgi:hypothetical protein
MSESRPSEPKRADFQEGGNARNPFASDLPATRPVGAIANAEQQRAIAEVQARMIIARANPRDAMRCMDLILRDCTRPSLAEAALYQYSRGGTSISGPSIRLAEAIAQRWGNIASGIKEISRANGFSECVAYAWDLETGYYDERQFQIKHWRDTRSGGYAITDERDIYELLANNGQRRKRAVLLTVIPGDVVEAAVAQCEETLSTSADTSPEALGRIATAFEQFGVTKAQIEKRCQCRLEAIRPAQVVQLRKIFASLKDGMSDAKDWFETPNGAWTGVEETHAANKPPAQTQPAAAETRAAPRKAAAKKAAAPPPPADDEVPFGRWDESPPATEAPAGGSSPTAAAPAPEAEGSPAPTQTSGVVPFSAWLVDGEGDPIPDEDGVLAEFTDPFAFARAYMNALDAAFPPDREAMVRANHESIVQAQMTPGVAAILVPQAERAPPPASDPAPGLGLDIPADPLVIPKPARMVKADLDAWNAAFEHVLYSLTTMDGIKQAVERNQATFETFPPKYRATAKGLVDTARKSLTPPLPKGVAYTTDDLARGLLQDIASFETGQDLIAWEAYTKVQMELDDLREKAPELHATVTAALEKRRAEFNPPQAASEANGKTSPDDLYAKLSARLDQCATVAEVTGLGNDQQYLAMVKEMYAADKSLWTKLSHAANERKRVITASLPG